MASSSNQDSHLSECSSCKRNLDFQSKTLPCLHSLCKSCIENNFKGKKDGENGLCPECQESMVLGQLNLSPIVKNTLKKEQQFERSELKCDLCFKEDGIESVAKNWCHECQELLCKECFKYHQRYNPDHQAKVVSATIDFVTANLCSLHLKDKNCYCEKCNVCLCDTCYISHPTDSPECSPRPLSMKEEVSRRKMTEGPTLLKEMCDLELILKRQIEKTKEYTYELKTECDSKCGEIWKEFELMKEIAKKRTDGLCEDLRRMRDEQVEKWSELLKENERILKQLNIWKINLKYLLSDSPLDVDVVCGMRTLGSKLTSRLKNPPSGPGNKKCHLTVNFFEWWPQLLKRLNDEKVRPVSLVFDKLSSAKSISSETKLILKVSNPDWCITSIYVSNEDNHIFICEKNTNSIMEFTEEGEFVGECLLIKQEGERGPLTPNDICWNISLKMLVVVAGQGLKANEKLIFLERKKRSFLEIENIIDTGRKMSAYLHRLCERNGEILICDSYLQINSFTKKGNKIKAITNPESGGPFVPLIRVDSSNGYFWLTKYKNDTSVFEIFCFNEIDQKIHSIKINEQITDFSFNEFGNFFCNWQGIFSFYHKKKLFEFEEESEIVPNIFVLRNKLYIHLRIKRQDFIEIFKICE